MYKLTVFTFCTFLFSLCFASIEGVWFNANKTGKIKIEKINDEYFGHIIWLETPLNELGKPKVDKFNPDENLKRKPMIGLKVLKNCKQESEFEFGGGTIYDPNNGKTYKCKMTLEGDNLDVRGYIGFSLLGRTERWTRTE